MKNLRKNVFFPELINIVVKLFFSILTKEISACYLYADFQRLI